MKEEQTAELSAAQQPEKAPKKQKDAERVRLFPAGKNGYHRMPLMDFLRAIFYPIHAVLYPFRMHGYKKVGPGPYIYVGNHYCLWDVFYPAHSTKDGIHYLAKDSILRAPVLGSWAKRVGVIGAMRDGTDVHTLMDAMRVLKNGEKISMFPEGTRNKGEGDDFLPFHGGAALLAIKTKTPVIPFVICNRPHVFRVTHVVFGEPMELKEFYGRKLTQSDYEAADEMLRNRLYELREEFRASRKKGKKKRG